jgi:hypothetical protein
MQLFLFAIKRLKFTSVAKGITYNRNVFEPGRDTHRVRLIA